MALLLLFAYFLKFKSRGTMDKIKYWVASFLIWVFWMWVQPAPYSMNPYVKSEPIIISVFIAIAEVLPWIIDTTEIIMYGMLRGP